MNLFNRNKVMTQKSLILSDGSIKQILAGTYYQTHLLNQFSSRKTISLKI